MSDASPPPLPPTEPFGPEPPRTSGTTAVLDEPPRPDRRPAPRRRRTVAIVAAVVAVLALVVAAAVGYWSGDDDDVATGPSTTVAPSSSTAVTEQPSTTVTDTTAATTTTVAAPAPVDTSTAIFPYASGTVRYDDPLDAARGFAVDYAGFTDPILGDFMQGDTRSGEVEVRAAADGPVSVVLVRQLDDSWWVLGAVTDGIDVAEPPMGEAITSPVTVRGTALAFEGHVDVQVRQDGTTEPLGRGYVTGAGAPPAGPFHGQVAFAPPTESYGSMVFTTSSAENGQVWQIAAYRIRFA